MGEGWAELTNELVNRGLGRASITPVGRREPDDGTVV